jgi:hypothetical protein
MLSTLARSLTLSACLTGAVVAQDPPRPDTARKPVALPAIETTAPRDERVAFEQKPNVGTISITGRELTSAPRFFGEADVLRAVRLLPGVNARNDYSVGMNVRGGEADQNLVLLDGYPIYNPFHMGGLFGAFVEPMVDRVDFLTGGFPARYGGRLSSVLDVRSREEPRPGTHGRVDLSFIATTLSLGGGMQQGQSSWNVAARRTYADKFADLFDPGSLPYHFTDMQAHATRVLPGDIRLSVTGYHNVDDMLGSGIDEDNTYKLNWGNDLVGATLSRMWRDQPRLFGRVLGDSALVEQRFSASRFELDMDFWESALTLHNRVEDDRVAGSLTTYTPKHTLALGYEVGAQRYRYDANYPLVIYPSDTLANRNSSAGVYFDDLWRPNDRWMLQWGLRADVVSGTGSALQPRISAKYFISRNLAVTASVGEFAQWAHSLAREDVPIRALDFWVGSDSRAPVSRARHFIGGVERWLSPTRALRVEAWFKQYPSLVELNPYSDPNVRGDEFIRLTGNSFGADLMLRQLHNGRFNGWLAYSFAYSSRVDTTGARFFPGQDRRHELNLVGNWTKRKYTLSTRFNLSSGTPYTRSIGDFERRTYQVGPQNFTNETLIQFLNGPRNAERLPLASRLDFSVTRNGSVGGVSVTPFLSIMNVYNAKNVFAYLYDHSALPPERVRLQQLPIFPTLGVSVVW